MKKYLKKKMLSTLTNQRHRRLLYDMKYYCDWMENFTLNNSDCIFFVMLLTMIQMNKCSTTQAIEDFLHVLKSEEKMNSQISFNQDVYDLEALQSSAMNLYAKDTFLYDFINNIIQANDYHKLFQMRFLIKCLINNADADKMKLVLPSTLYRAGELPTEKVLSLQQNIHKPIMLRRFIYTTSEISIAENFFREKKTDEGKCKILLKINIDNHHTTSNCFRWIYDSESSSDSEFLLNCCSILTLDTIESRDRYIQIDCSFSDSHTTDIEAICRKMNISWQKFNEMLEKDYYDDNFLLFEIFNRMIKHEECISILDGIPNDNLNILCLKIEKYKYLGYLFIQRLKYDHALECYQKVLSLASQAIVVSHSEYSNIYYTLGLICGYKNDYENAIYYYSAALNITIAALGENNCECAMFHNLLGLMYEKKGDYDNAIKSFEETYRLYGNQGWHFLNMIAGVYLAKGDYATALEYCNRALQSTLTSQCYNNQAIGNIYSKIGEIYFTKGDFEQSLISYQQALFAKTKLIGDYPPNTVPEYLKLGEISAAKGLFDDALHYYDNARLGLISHHKEESPEMINVYQCIGELNALKGDNDSAVYYYQLALNIVLSIDSVDVTAAVRLKEKIMLLDFKKDTI